MTQTSVALIEDDPWLAQSYSRVCERAGYTVSTAMSPQTAIDLIDDAKPDVIVLDLMLRGGDGVVLLHELASHADLATIPIIMLTTQAPEMDEASLKSYNVSQLLDKTMIEPDDLVAAIRRVLL